MIRVLSTCLFLLFSYFLYAQISRNISPEKSHQDIDSQAYIERAHLLYTTNTLAREHETNTPYFALGYPAIMGLLFKIFGESKIIIILFQVLLSLCISFLIFLTARRLFSIRVAQITALLFSCNLGFLVFSQFILTETCLVFFLVLFFERFSDFLVTHKSSSLITAGISLGCSVIIKPAALYFPILLVPLIFIVTSEKIQTPGSYRALALPVLRSHLGVGGKAWISVGGGVSQLYLIFLLLVSFAVPITIYSVHNKYVFGSYKQGSLDQVNIYFWFFPHVLAQENGTNSDIERAYLINLNNHDPLFTPVKKLFWQKLTHNPVRFIIVWLKNVFKTTVGLYTTNLKVLVDPNVHGGDISFFRINGTLLQKIHNYIVAGTSFCWVKTIGYLEACWSVIRYLLCLLGFIGLIRDRRYKELYFFSTYLFYFSCITGHDGCARFRMLFEFVLVILAAYGLCLIIGCIKNNRVTKKNNQKRGLGHDETHESATIFSRVCASKRG